MKQLKSFLYITVAMIAAGLMAVSGAQAAIIYSGDLYPADPSLWTSSTDGYVGNTANGTLAIDSGSTVLSNAAYLGYTAGVTGTATVNGGGSSWTNSGDLTVGYYGSGSLTIANGASVSNATSILGRSSGASGTVVVDGAGSTWTNSGYVYVGYEYGNGSLAITNGATVSSANSRVGYWYSTGTAVVDGPGSKWINSGFMNVASYVGTGTLTITNGGTVSDTEGSIGSQDSGTTGVVTVDGIGSGWINSGNLKMLTRATTLNVRNGGKVTAAGYFGALGTVNVDGAGSQLTIGDRLWNDNMGSSTPFILNITNGGGLSVGGYACLGSSGYSGGTTRVTVDGVGSKWTIGGYLRIASAKKHTASVTVSNGGNVSVVGDVSVGYNSTATGTLTVDGSGSSFGTRGSLSIGTSGTGTLNILNGATVTADKATTIGSKGVLDFGDNGGTLTTGTFSGTSSQATGTGTILTRGWLGDSDLLFDASHGLVPQAVATWNGTGQNITVNFAPSSIPGVGGDLAAGYQNSGSLTIKDGLALASGTGYVGYLSGSTGKAVISGTGSKWALSSNGYIAYNTGSTGKVIVNGPGAALTATGTIYTGYRGTGTLSVTSGAAVTAGTSLYIVDSTSMLIADTASTITAPMLYNNGTVRLVAGAGAAAGTYTPISATTWNGSGTYQALGGIWNDTTHTMTVSDAALAFAGRATTIDLASTQRMLIIDPVTAQVAGMSFLGATTSTPITMTASVMSGTALSALQGVLASDQKVLSAWNFTPGTGYTSGSPVYLSLFAGPDQDLSTLGIWHYDGSAWSAFTANDLAYDGTYASFTVTGFSGYAVSGTAPAPIPAAVWLLGSGLAGLIGFRRRRRNRTLS